MDPAAIKALVANITANVHQQVQAANQAANQANVDAAVAAALQAFQANLPAPPAPPPAAPFAIGPVAAANANDPWDFSTPHGLKFYFEMNKPLSTKFAGKQEGIRNFLSKLGIVAKRYGWITTILTIPDATPAATPRNLITQYGLITLQEINTHATGYMGQDTRGAQASQILASVILDSIEEDVRSKLLVKEAEYTMDLANGTREINGPLLLKSLLKLASLTTRSTVARLQQEIHSLTTIMTEVSSDIVAFNLRVDDICAQLLSLGEQPHDLLAPLFIAYSKVSDTYFVNFIDRKRSDYNAEGANMNLTATDLMSMAEGCYKERISEKTWVSPAAIEAEFVALQAANASEAAAQVKGDKSKTSSKKAKKGKANRDSESEVWAWKGVAPSPGQPREKTFRNKAYIYCENHGTTKWVLKNKHDVCKNAPPVVAPHASKPNADAAPPAISSDGLRYLKALLSQVESDDEED